MNAQVLVVGAVNVDMVARTDRRPAGGETVVATGYRRASGGKGANQAAAAARAGAAVALLAAVGGDEAGADQVRELAGRGVDTGPVVVVPGVDTGVAMIVVTPDGENSIVVIPGANDHLAVGHVEAAVARNGEPGVLVLQTEIDGAVLDHAVRRSPGSRVVINNGPWLPLSADTLRRADPLVVNQYEALDACAGIRTDVPPERLAGAVREVTGARSVLVTLGAGGVAISDGGADTRVPAQPASSVVDTTGAGDTFVGTLAAHLALGSALSAAVRAAVAASSDAVTWHGARAPIPDLRAVTSGAPVQARRPAT